MSPPAAAFFPPPPPALLLCIFEDRSHNKTLDRGLVKPDLKKLVDCSITQPLRYDRPSLQDLCTATGQCTGPGGAVSRRSKVTIETDHRSAHAYKTSCSFVQGHGAAWFLLWCLRRGSPSNCGMVSGTSACWMVSGDSTGETDQSNNQQINQLSTKFISLEAPKVLSVLREYFGCSLRFWP